MSETLDVFPDFTFKKGELLKTKIFLTKKEREFLKLSDPQFADFEKFEKSMKEYLATPVEEIMVKRVKTVRQDSPVSEIARIMVKDRINRIPVVDESNKAIGIISRADILKSMIGEIED